MKRIALMVLLVLVIFGCGKNEATTAEKDAAWIEAGKTAVRAKLKDSHSAEFRNAYVNRGKDGIPMTCGEVNSKNAVGGCWMQRESAYEEKIDRGTRKGLEG